MQIGPKVGVKVGPKVLVNDLIYIPPPTTAGCPRFMVGLQPETSSEI